jgi:predicted DNA-binding protein (UPF0251 family)
LNQTTQKSGPFEDYISQVEAARIRGVSPQAIANLIRRGRLKAVSMVGRILVLRSEVEGFVPRSQGRPSKKALAGRDDRRKSREVVKPSIHGKYISQAEAARIRGISQEAIADLIRRSRLSTAVVAGRTLLLRAEVEAFAPKPIGRPPKKIVKTNKSKKTSEK